MQDSYHLILFTLLFTLNNHHRGDYYYALLCHKKSSSTFLKRRGLSKRLSTIVSVKNCKERLTHSPLATSGVQTPSKLQHDKTQKWNVVWKWNFADMLIFMRCFTWNVLKPRRRPCKPRLIRNKSFILLGLLQLNYAIRRWSKK